MRPVYFIGRWLHKILIFRIFCRSKRRGKSQNDPLGEAVSIQCNMDTEVLKQTNQWSIVFMSPRMEFGGTLFLFCLPVCVIDLMTFTMTSISIMHGWHI